MVWSIKPSPRNKEQLKNNVGNPHGYATVESRESEEIQYAAS